MALSDECFSTRSNSTLSPHVPSSNFRCSNHENKKIKYFNHADKKFLCSICQFEEKITKDIAFKVDEDVILDHAKLLADNLNKLIDELTGSLNHLTLIYKKEAVYTGDEIQDAFEKASRILTGYIDEPKAVKELKSFNRGPPTSDLKRMDLKVLDTKILQHIQKQIELSMILGENK